MNTFNIRIQQMPDAFVASFMNVTPQPMFEVEASEKADVPMAFGAANRYREASLPGHQPSHHGNRHRAS